MNQSIDYSLDNDFDRVKRFYELHYLSRFHIKLIVVDVQEIDEMKVVILIHLTIKVAVEIVDLVVLCICVILIVGIVVS